MLKSVLPGIFCLMFSFVSAQNDSLMAKTNYFSIGFSISHTPFIYHGNKFSDANLLLLSHIKVIHNYTITPVVAFNNSLNIKPNKNDLIKGELSFSIFKNHITYSNIYYMNPIKEDVIHEASTNTLTNFNFIYSRKISKQLYTGIICGIWIKSLLKLEGKANIFIKDTNNNVSIANSYNYNNKLKYNIFSNTFNNELYLCPGFIFMYNFGKKYNNWECFYRYQFIFDSPFRFNVYSFMRAGSVLGRNEFGINYIFKKR